MQQVNRNSIYCDGIENVEHGSLVYTNELLEKVKNRFDVDIPKRVKLYEVEEVAELLINNIIKKFRVIINKA